MQDQIQGCLSQGLIKELFAAYLGDTAQQLYYQDIFFGGSKPFRLAISDLIYLDTDAFYVAEPGYSEI
jgi:hypothetical protein